MKKLISVMLFTFLVMCLTSCSGHESHEDWHSSGYNTGYEDGWNNGFDDGYNEGLIWGAIDGQDDIASEVKYQYEKREADTTKSCGLHPEEAIMVLEDYINGKSVSEEDLHMAIKSVSYFYYEAWEVVASIEDMDVTYDFH